MNSLRTLASMPCRVGHALNDNRNNVKTKADIYISCVGVCVLPVRTVLVS